MTTQNKTSNGLPLPLGTEYPNRELMTYTSNTIESLFGENLKSLNLGGEHTDKSVKGGLEYLNKKINSVDEKVDDLSKAAKDITIEDSGDYFKANNVEDALAEIGKDIKSAVKATEQFVAGL